METIPTTPSQTRSFTTIFLIEMWERFGFYGMQALIVYYMAVNLGAMIARYVPARMGGFMMGAYFVASGVAQYLGGVVATYASVPRNITDPLESLPIYTSLFNKLGVAALVCTAIAIAVLPLMNRLSRTHSEHARANEV